MKTSAMFVLVAAVLAGCGSSGGDAISLSPGFTPDPTTATGTAGGPQSASELSSSCNGGNIANNPNHTLTAGGTFPNLRIMARSDGDTTIVVRKPDGSYECNDDSDGLNPMVTLTNAPAGEYRIWVGTFQDDASPSYTLGISELPTTTPSSLN